MYTHTDKNFDVSRHHKFKNTSKLGLLILLALILPFGAILAACASDKGGFDSITITKASFEMTVGQTVQFDASLDTTKEENKSKISWSSSDTSVLVINETTGLAEAKSVGTAQVTVKSTVDSRAFSSIQVSVTRSAQDEFLNDWDDTIHYDSEKLPETSIEDLAKLYNDLESLMNQLDQVLEGLSIEQYADFFKELEPVFDLYSQWMTVSVQYLREDIKSVLFQIDVVQQYINDINDEINIATTNINVTQDKIDTWKDSVVSLETNYNQTLQDFGLIENIQGQNQIESIYISLTKDNLTQFDEDIGALKSVVDALRPSQTSSYSSNKNEYANLNLYENDEITALSNSDVSNPSNRGRFSISAGWVSTPINVAFVIINGGLWFLKTFFKKKFISVVRSTFGKVLVLLNNINKAFKKATQRFRIMLRDVNDAILLRWFSIGGIIANVIDMFDEDGLNGKITFSW